jgi:hypothetical protein
MNATDVRSKLGARFDNPEVIGGMPLAAARTAGLGARLGSTIRR